MSTTNNPATSEGEKVPEIPILTDRVRVLNQATDWWNAMMILALVLAAFSAVAVVGTTMMALRRAKQAGDAQAELIQAKDLQLTLDLGDRDVKIGQASKDAADAKGAMAKQQERAAMAERSLLELRERIKPRHLTDKDALAFVAALKTLPVGIIDFGCTSGGGDESLNLAKEFLPLFKQAGWTVRNSASIANHLDAQVIGVGILVSVAAGPDAKLPPSGNIALTPTLKALQDAFRAVRIDVQFISWFPGKDAPEVVIGSKPEPTP